MFHLLILITGVIVGSILGNIKPVTAFRERFVYRAERAALKGISPLQDRPEHKG